MCNPSLASPIFIVASFSTTPTLLFRSPASPTREPHSCSATRHAQPSRRSRRRLPRLQSSRTGSQTARLSSKLTPPTTPSPPFSPLSRKITNYIPLPSTPVHLLLPNSTTTSTIMNFLLFTKCSAFGATTLKVPRRLLTSSLITKISNISPLPSSSTAARRGGLNSSPSLTSSSASVPGN